MPMFDMLCDACGYFREDKYIRQWEDKYALPCEKCGEKTVPLITRININLDSTFAGWDDVMEVDLRGASHRKLEMAKRGLIEKDTNIGGRRKSWV